MKPNKIILPLVCFALVFALGGCGASEKEKAAANERARLELEKKQEQEIRDSSKAVTEMSKKLGKKPPAIDLGLPTTTTQPAQTPTTDPAKSKQP